MSLRRSASHWGAFRAEVEAGRVMRVLPFEHDRRPSPLNGCWTHMVDSPLRVAHPVVRRGWLEGDGGAARGEDRFVEISWDDALDRVAGEIARVRDAYGNKSLFAGSYGWSSAGRVHHARTLVRRFFSVLGGFTDQTTNYSYGAAMAFLPRIVGVRNAVGAALTSVASIRGHCDIMLAFGGIPAKNWEVQSGGFGEHRYDDFMRDVLQTTHVVSISPFRGDVEADHPVQWLPIRPNTDTALMLALMQVLVERGEHDAAFLARYCEGADKLIAYLNGAGDGLVKSPEWASMITGVPSRQIEQLARELPGKRVMVTANWSLQRARHGEQPYWAAIALAAMLGQIGLPGGGFAFGYGSANGMGNPRYDTPIHGLPVGGNGEGVTIPVARIADLLLEPGSVIRFDGEEIALPHIRLVYWAGGNPFHHHQDLNRLRAAFRRPETVVVHENYWTATARHADIVLPATIALERNDIGGISRDRFVLAMEKATEPFGAARNDYDIFAALGQRLGIEQAFTEGRTADDWLRWSWFQTRNDLTARGIEAPGFETFWRDGYFRMPDPERDYVMFADFRADPDANRLPTPSGRIELYSNSVARITGGRMPGHPAWLDPEEWLGADLARQYPLHLLTPQPARRLHGQMDWSDYSRAGKKSDREYVTMNPHDAKARGIEDGDFARIFNDRGACLAAVRCDDGVLAGVALLPTGATYDPDGKSDRGSNPNVLTRDIGTSELGQGCAAQSCLVEIEKWDGDLPDLRTMRPPAIDAAA